MQRIPTAPERFDPGLDPFSQTMLESEYRETLDFRRSLLLAAFRLSYVRRYVFDHLLPFSWRRRNSVSGRTSRRRPTFKNAFLRPLISLSKAIFRRAHKLGYSYVFENPLKVTGISIFSRNSDLCIAKLLEF